MRIDGLGDTSPGVAEYHFYDRVVDPGGVEQGCQRVPALMRRMMHRHPLHCSVPAAPKSVVSVDRTNLFAPLPICQEWEDTMTDGNLADTSLSLAVPDVNIALADLYVLRPQGQILTDAETRIYQNQYVLDILVISLLPKPVDFANRERPLFVDDAVPVNLDIS